MSAQGMSHAERVQAISGLGYAQREAAFLCLAALHGGYFLRRHYAGFLGQEIGGTVAALTEKLLSQRHAVAIMALNHTNIYHLNSRPFYTTIGEPDNRNRREHAPEAIKSRLVGLDFVLAHPGYRYLATEQEKLDYFCGTLGIAISALPYKRYISLKTASTTTRYFVDKFPIFLKESWFSDTRPTPCFCFIDPGATTLSAFETYLAQYSNLWSHLKGFNIIYVADTSRLFAAAERLFLAFSKELEGANSQNGEGLTARVLEHFVARFLYEKGEFGSFSRDKLIRLRNESAKYSGAKYQALYERWKATRTERTPSSIGPEIAHAEIGKGTFSASLVEHPYDFFGKISPPNELPKATAGPTPRGGRGVGGVDSASIEEGAP